MIHNILKGMNLNGGRAYKKDLVLVNEHSREQMRILEMDFRRNLLKLLIQIFYCVKMLNHEYLM